MGLTHGGQRQKNFNMYEEATNIPLIFSNPVLYKRARSVDALVSHVDFLPTMASLFGAPQSARSAWQGRDYASIVLGGSRKPVQDYLLFTYDDYQAGQAQGPYVAPPQHVLAMREKRWKIGLYFDENGKVPPQWELYDLQNDPLEQVNIAYRGFDRTPAQQQQFRRLQTKLVKVYGERMQPLSGTAPFPVKIPGVNS
jgi:arylsulfatase A-like enzyme